MVGSSAATRSSWPTRTNTETAWCSTSTSGSGPSPRRMSRPLTQSRPSRWWSVSPKQAMRSYSAKPRTTNLRSSNTTSRGLVTPKGDSIRAFHTRNTTNTKKRFSTKWKADSSHASKKLKSLKMLWMRETVSFCRTRLTSRFGKDPNPIKLNSSPSRKRLATSSQVWILVRKLL